MEKQPITFTDIRPGFVRTDLLKDGRNYPMLMSPQYAALRIANAIDRKKRRAIIDWKYAILVFLWRLILNGFGNGCQYGIRIGYVRGSSFLLLHLDFLLRREHAEGPRRLFGNYPIHHNRHMY